MSSHKKRPKYIKSYGIILFYVEKGFERDYVTPKFLLMQRRDNYEYMDILRGNWSVDARLKQLWNGLSDEERTRLKNYPFEKLWDDLWITQGKGIHIDGFEKAKRKFQTLTKERIENLSSSSDEDVQPPWGFPKGRKNNGELEKDCALREFEEETKIKAKNIKLCGKVGPIAEFYKGKDSKNYCTYYFLAEAYKMEPIKKMDTPQCIRQTSVSEEAADLKWVTYEEAKNLLVNRRKNILKHLNELIKRYYEKVSPLRNYTRRPNPLPAKWGLTREFKKIDSNIVNTPESTNKSTKNVTESEH